MTLDIYAELEQGTDEWLAARCGMVTASVVGKLLTPTLRVADNDASRGVTMTLAAERITGHVEPTYRTPDMWRGVIEEPLARDLYAEHYRTPVSEVGFMVRRDSWGALGYSPDGLVGDDGLIEVKSRSQKHQVRTVISPRAALAYHMAQMQAGLLVSGRAWCDYISYSSGMAMWVHRVTPDPTWQLAITQAVAAFEAAASDIADRYRAATAGLPVADRTPDADEIEV